MAALEQEMTRLNRGLADEDIYTRQPAKFAAATEGLEADQESLAEAEEQWLALEMQREALEGA